MIDPALWLFAYSVAVLVAFIVIGLRGSFRHKTMTDEAPRGNLVRVGQDMRVEMTGGVTEQLRHGLIIEFDNAEDVRRAMAEGRCSFTLFEPAGARDIGELSQ